MLSMDTGLNDKTGIPIHVGDILKNDDGFFVLACQSETGYYGSLICPIEHSCRNIPYSLNDGSGYRILIPAGNSFA